MTVSGSKHGWESLSSVRMQLVWPMVAAAHELTPRCARVSWSVTYTLPVAAFGWLFVQNHGEDDPDQYWIGRATRIVKTHTASGTVQGAGRARYGPGDLEIEVEWLDRTADDIEWRTFELWEAPAGSPTFNFNSTKLRMVNVVLEVVRPPRQELHVVARERRSAAVACDVRRRHSLVVRGRATNWGSPAPDGAGRGAPRLEARPLAPACARSS
jgi:hypothetical protein